MEAGALMAAPAWPAAAQRALLLVTAAVLAGCAAPQKPLYQWGGYQAALYNHLRGKNADMGTQIAQLEAQAQRTAAEGAVPPPGLHGHLALLYSKTGDDANALRHLQIERKLFPESATYIDHLLKNAARTAPKS